MLFYTSELKSYRIDATDGEMGKVQDLYFDDHCWTIRYAIIDTRKWLPGRSVYLSPTSFVKLNEIEKLVEVNYDKDTIRNSPSIPDNEPLTRSTESTLSGYYGWSKYWFGTMLWGVQDQPFTRLPDHATDKSEFTNELQTYENKDYNLRSEEEVLQMKVHANDGKLGVINDIIFDDEYWKIRYFVLKSAEVPAEHYYLLEADTIESVDWLERDLYVNYTVDRVRQQRSYDTKEGIIKSL
ncbi:PRC-barrel domain-containing protein [Virgibacillus ndiopensis]|uniref:PRC-barrel domain-containing protein n=1 Tax=Virgibacillus ndiopensis TaxID=2004408 RepID=UPI000C08D558|nr:PRC-barrel domain-containing protein [Virgibacillus ndiopensis]